MSITIKKLPKPELPICHMNCDKPLHKKLTKYPFSDLFFNKASTTGILGKPSQGKSSLIYSWFKSPAFLKKCYNTVFYICPSNSMDSMSDNIFKKLPEDQIYNELSGDILDEIHTRAMNREDGDKICIIIDDMASQLKNNDVQKKLKQIAMNKRHLGIYNTFILSQTWKSIPFEVRRLYDNIIMFKVSPDELESFFNETLPQYKPYSNELKNIIYDKPHQYLAVNTNSGRIFKNMDEILINDEI